VSRAARAEPRDPFFAPEAAPTHVPGARRLGFELSSRGDRVTGRLLLPAQGAGPFPLVLLQHGAGGSKDSPYLDAASGRWVEAGAAVASIDFPLHGDRANAKLSADLLRGLAGRGAPAPGDGVRLGLVRQAVADLAATLDVLCARSDVDGTRTVYAGFSMGAILGSLFLARDARPRAAALALGGGGFGPEEADPARHIGRFSPRPLLFVNASQDEVIPRQAAEALHAAAGEPKEVVWFDTTHAGLRGVALKTMWTFLRRHIAL